MYLDSVRILICSWWLSFAGLRNEVREKRCHYSWIFGDCVSSSLLLDKVKRESHWFVLL